MIVMIASAVSMIERSSSSTRLVFHSSIRILMDTTRTITVITISGMTMDTQLWRYSGDLLALAIIVDPSMGSWGLERDEQFALTSATTICPPGA